MAIKKYGYGYARKKRLLKWEEDEENLFKKNHNPEENKKKNLHLQTGKNIAFSGRASQTDRYAHLEYSRLYFPPEISRM